MGEGLPLSVEGVPVPVVSSVREGEGTWYTSLVQGEIGTRGFGIRGDWYKGVWYKGRLVRRDLVVEVCLRGNWYEG